MSEQKALQNVRQEIDALDEKIQTLINARTALAHQVAEIKQQQADQSDFYRPEREAMILRRVMERNTGPLPDKEMARLFREIMSACLAAEKPLSIAYLGPEGSFTQSAALKHFGGSAELLPVSTIANVFSAVETEHACYGVVPVENSTEGMVSHTLDRFISSSLKINGEVSLRIHHYLLGKGENLSDVKTVYAHPQALAQCRQWLGDQLPQAALIPLDSNAEAARRVSTMDETAAAIAASNAAEIYNLTVLANNIEDEAGNTTRFLVIGRQDVGPSGADKTALLVSTKNKPGALQKLLQPLAENQISMSRIESRPSRKGIWEYVFFIDIEGHSQDSAVADALAKLESESSMFRVLGAYPKAVL
ncbi:Chorismate mutase I / Prephenate dehydratase [Methylophaga frappieri]|uniref:Bifunctional chorismate mutase/prephenate dehydratase n=1 Tax=Methylophaga frappieri (strain ATCC BAA-2434 / DSM 25690 / JAM7) TaxID=754477 RepID=I1YEG8_METFJ|nr:prephenate dehydratase [Methylophaga frappieri]AFJ01311.1 Chorismate mutase I / Prephenate dehydratase [Methylophaga frappieri]